MLNPFPYLLVFQFFVPTLLRITVGTFFLLSGGKRISKRKEADISSFSEKYGKFAGSLVWYVGIVEVLVGLSLIAGFLTQVGALVGAVIALKMLWFRKKYPSIASQERAVYVLVLVICLSLLFTGAGAIAFDLPL